VADEHTLATLKNAIELDSTFWNGGETPERAGAVELEFSLQEEEEVLVGYLKKNTHNCYK
jgi:hypothetical protein